MRRFIVSLLMMAFASGVLLAEDKDKEKEKDKDKEPEKKAESIFPDKNLEAAVRKFVFEKRDNDKPIVESDVVQLSTINGVGMNIKDLTGLEKCRSLASLDLARNQISNLSPLKGLANVQYLNLAGN